MSTHRVEVVRLGPIHKHPNADTLGYTEIWGYTAIVRLGDFQEGELAAYIEPDFVVPAAGTHPEAYRFAFLKDNLRVKARRLRGMWSQGLLIKLQETDSYAAGDDVMDAWGIVRYDPDVHPKFKTQTTGEKAPPVLQSIPKYDLEPLRRYKSLFAPGEEVYVTEKLHGCVPDTTRVTMADGAHKRFFEVKVGDYVMGVDASGLPTPAKVLQKFNNGVATDGWLKISGKRRGVGRGAANFVLRCTPNHRVWNSDIKDYVEARYLKEGDSVATYRSENGLTPLQKSVLLGKLLGDGSLTVTEASASMSWGHKESDAEYSWWTAKALGGLTGADQRPFVSGYGTRMVRMRTVSCALVKSKFGALAPRSPLPAWVAEELDPIAIAFWYMDDGSLAHHDGQEDRAMFAACSFSREECKILQSGLKRFNIDSVYYESNGYSRLRLNADSAERLFLLIAPYVPKCMQRKLPARYRGHEGWLPTGVNTYKAAVVSLTIDTVESDTTVDSKRYDMETETHNYFANGILVHNCNARYTFHEGRIWVGSRTQWKKKEPGDLWWSALNQNGWIADFCQSMPDVVLYGEVFGQVQDLKYGTKPGELRFLAFDIYDLVLGRWLDAAAFMELISAWGALTGGAQHHAPLLYKGPFDFAKLEELSRQDSVIGPHLSEGVVVKPATERAAHVGRVAFKLVSDRYLER